METVAFCEIDPYCRAVLRKHWPHVPCYEDIRDLTANRLFQDSHGELPDVLCGGFPCQDISVAGKGAGIAGERSGLWSEYARLIREIQPRWVIVENVSALLARGLEQVLGDLAAIGYDSEWHCIPAAYVGAPHRRDRIWIIAHPNGAGLAQQSECYSRKEFGENRACGGDTERLRDPLAYSPSDRLQGARPFESSTGLRRRPSDPGEALANAVLVGRGQGHSDTGGSGSRTSSPQERRGSSIGRWWETEPAVGRVVDGFPGRVDQLRCLGNAVVPQIPEIIGRAIMQHDSASGSQT